LVPSRPDRPARFAGRLVTLTDLLAATVTAVIFVVMAAQVVSRYGFNSSLFWADELAVWGLGWLVMLACVGLAWEWRHVHVPMVLLALPLRWRAPMIVFSKVVTLAFLLVLLWYGVQVFMAGFHRTAPGLGLSTRWLKLAIPVSAALMSVVIGLAVLRDLVALRSGDLRHFARYGPEGSAD
jgi:TRAP-type transport system small permease protein